MQGLLLIMFAIHLKKLGTFILNSAIKLECFKNKFVVSATDRYGWFLDTIKSNGIHFPFVQFRIFYIDTCQNEDRIWYICAIYHIFIDLCFM